MASEATVTSVVFSVDIGTEDDMGVPTFTSVKTEPGWRISLKSS